MVKFADSKKQGGKSKGDFGFDDMGSSYPMMMPMNKSSGGGHHLGGPADYWQQQQSQGQKMMYPYNMQQQQHQPSQQHMLSAPYSPYSSQSQPMQQQRFMYMSGNSGPSAPNYYHSNSGGSGGQSPFLASVPGANSADYGQEMGDGGKKFGKSQVAGFPQGDREALGGVKTSGGGYSVVPPAQQFDQDGADSQQLQGSSNSVDHEPHSRPPEGCTLSWSSWIGLMCV